MKYLIYILLLTLTSFSCNKSDSDRSIEGIYSGYFKSVDDYNGNLFFETNDAQLSLVSCNDGCAELTFITDNGSTTADAEYIKNSTFYSLDITPVYEFPGSPQTWELDWENGQGTFDFINNQMTLTLKVSDEHAIGSSDAIYFFEGSQN